MTHIVTPCVSPRWLELFAFCFRASPARSLRRLASHTTTARRNPPRAVLPKPTATRVCPTVTPVTARHVTARLVRSRSCPMMAQCLAVRVDASALHRVMRCSFGVESHAGSAHRDPQVGVGRSHPRDLSANQASPGGPPPVSSRIRGSQRRSVQPTSSQDR